MATQEATPGSQSENSALELPSACDIRDYMLREASQEAPSEVASSVEALSIPSSSEVDPASSRKMEAAKGEELLPQRLPELFDTCQRLLDEVEVAAEPTSSQVVQEKVLKGLHLLKLSAEMLLQLDSFSHNEDLEDIASSDLKYLMVPALQGALALKQVNPSKRLDDLQWAQEQFLIYLTQCQHYHVAESELPKTKNNSAENDTAGSSMAHPNLVVMASQRQAKIERHKQKKEVECRLSAMKAAVESGEADDEHVREYYLLRLRRWISISLEEINSIDQEIKILREKDSPEEVSAPGSTPQSSPLMKPFILTRNAAQAKVFGAGYPSLASLTVNDWYDQHRKVGALPDQGIPRTASEVRRGAQQHEEQEQKEGEDGGEVLQRAREWDDWKDTHPRGYGNRQNMDTSNLNTIQNDSWTSENFWLDPSAKGQPETDAEDDELRKSLDRFYEMFSHPQAASGNPLSASVCQCLSQKINELKGQENQKYALRSFQMARVILNRDGCSELRRHSRDTRFYPLDEESVSLEDEKPTPGLSKDIIHFLLQQNVMKDL